MLKRLKVNEVFMSCQGEGFHTGMPAVFIRLSGCNMSCKWCDTKHQDGLLYSFEPLLETTSKIGGGCKNVILTGGEPCIQEGFFDFCRLLFVNQWRVFIETNGTVKMPSDVEQNAWITVSPKELPQNLKQHRGNELKLVYHNHSTATLKRFRRLAFNYFYLQPCWVKDNWQKTIENTKTTYNRVLDSDGMWRLSIQVQKLINVR